MTRKARISSGSDSAAGGAPCSFGDFVVARAWWAGAPLSDLPLAEFVMRRDAPLPELVSGFLGAIGFHEDHLWLLAQPRDPVGRRRVGNRNTWWVPEAWRHMSGPAEAEPLDASTERADAFTLAELAAGDGDEAWLLFDFGDHHTFRFKFNALDANRAAARAARAALQEQGLSLPAAASREHAVVLRSTRVEQYPSFAES